jgi:hypothetical protein
MGLTATKEEARAERTKAAVMDVLPVVDGYDGCPVSNIELDIDSRWQTTEW